MKMTFVGLAALVHPGMPASRLPMAVIITEATTF